MRLPAVAAIGVLLALPAAAHAQSCRAPHSHTVVKTRQARVYWQGIFKDHLGHRHRRYYGCAPHAPGRYRFNQRGDIGIVRLDPRGTEVLYTDSFSEPGGRRYAVVRDADVINGRYHQLTGTLQWRYGGAGRRPAITGLVARFVDVSSFALIGTNDRTAGTWQVRKADISTLGKVRLLDSGPAIVPGSLRLAGSALSWLHADGSEHGAVLDQG